jgi:DNA-binding NarL/FixJ family response regulator
LLFAELLQITAIHVPHGFRDRARWQEAVGNCPVVVLTSSSEERDVMRTYDVGANSYIVKPVDFEQFTESVRDIGKYWLMSNHTHSS